MHACQEKAMAVIIADFSSSRGLLCADGHACVLDMQHPQKLRYLSEH